MLGRAASQLVIGKAIRSKAKLAFPAAPTVEVNQWSATAESEAGAQIQAIATRPEEATLPEDGTNCWVLLELENRLYCFESCVHVQSGNAACHILIDRPAKVRLVERRRTRRCRFARTTPVEICTDGPDTSAFGGVVLNLSPDGLACMIDKAGGNVNVGGDARVRFNLAGASRAFELPCTVTSVTPSGDTGSVIVGVAFRPGEAMEAERIRLTRVLAVPQ